MSGTQVHDIGHRRRGRSERLDHPAHAKVQRSEQEQWATLPVPGVLAKPFDPVALPAAISELLGWS